MGNVQQKTYRCKCGKRRAMPAVGDSRSCGCKAIATNINGQIKWGEVSQLAPLSKAIKDVAHQMRREGRR